MKKEKVMETLQKLISAQGDGSVNINEIETANKLMKKLMLKYDIEEHQIEKIKNKESNVNQSKHSIGLTRPRNWVKILSMAISKFYDCKVITQGGTFYFIGFEMDRQICVEMFVYLYKAICNEGRYECGIKKSNEFKSGASISIFNRLQKMKNELKQEIEKSKDLVVLKEIEIKNFQNEKWKNLRKNNIHSARKTNSFYNGVEYGNNINLNKQIR